ncbi:MAG TPA: protein translocase subunit SecD [Gemmatimonadaceae bacterium]|nr:protein translocase subunit SecD [Gemmatimonadaceae bacterium]
MTNLRYRLLLIVAMCLVSIYFLVPRTVKIPTRGKDGVLRTDTVRRIPLRKGLDLQGGMYLELAPDLSKQTLTPDKMTDAVKRAVETVRNRVDAMGVSETSVQTAGATSDKIVVQIPGIQDPARAAKLVEEQAFLQFLIVDKAQALERSLSRLDDAVKQAGAVVAAAPTTETPAAQTTGLENLLRQQDTGKKADTGKGGKGGSKAAGGRKDSLAKAKDSAAADTTKPTNGAFSSLINQGSMPGEYFVANDKGPLLLHYLDLAQVKAAFPPGKAMYPGRDTIQRGGIWYRPFYVVDANPILTGAALTDAKPNTNPTKGTVVEFTLSNADGRRFRVQTGKHVGDYMAIVLDGLVIGQPPVIQEAIGTSGEITLGGRDISVAQDLALVLRAGALPVPLRIVNERTIGPSLGQDSIDKGVRAGILALGLVVVIMIGYYRFSGMLAVGGLALYVLFTAATLAGFDAVLTLPGLAGFVLSIGIAVDANVLIFERIREEMDRGKTPRTSIDEGFTHAMPAIIDSNVSTILTAAVLYQYGTGPVRGFAVTLIAGIVASLVTSIFVVRTFYLLWLNRTRGAQTLSI